VAEWLVFVRKWTGRSVDLPPIHGRLADDFPVEQFDDVPDTELLPALETWADEWVKERFGTEAEWQRHRAREAAAKWQRLARQRIGSGGRLVPRGEDPPTEADFLARIQGDSCTVLSTIYWTTDVILERSVTIHVPWTDERYAVVAGRNKVAFVHDQAFLLLCVSKDDAKFVAHRLDRERFGDGDGVMARYGFIDRSGLTDDEWFDALEQLKQTSVEQDRAKEILALRRPGGVPEAPVTLALVGTSAKSLADPGAQGGNGAPPRGVEDAEPPIASSPDSAAGGAAPKAALQSKQGPGRKQRKYTRQDRDAAAVALARNPGIDLRGLADLVGIPRSTLQNWSELKEIRKRAISTVAGEVPEGFIAKGKVPEDDYVEAIDENVSGLELPD